MSVDQAAVLVLWSTARSRAAVLAETHEEHHERRMREIYRIDQEDRDENAGQMSVLAGVPEDEEQDPERWDGMGRAVTL